MTTIHFRYAGRILCPHGRRNRFAFSGDVNSFDEILNADDNAKACGHCLKAAAKQGLPLKVSKVPGADFPPADGSPRHDEEACMDLGCEICGVIAEPVR